MTNKDDGGPAFPVAEDHQTADQLPWTQGMSLRDWFAGQALVGLATLEADCGPRGLAQDAYAMADAMLAARTAGEGEKQ